MVLCPLCRASIAKAVGPRPPWPRPAPGRILLLARLTGAIAVRWGRGFGDGVRRRFRRHHRYRPSSPPNDLEFCRAGTFLLRGSFVFGPLIKERRMHGLIYLIGLIVVILAILSFFGLR